MFDYYSKHDDNGCFKSCLVRYLNPADHHAARFTKAAKICLMFLILKTKSKTRIPATLVFFCYEFKKKYPIYVSKKCCAVKHSEKEKTLCS